MYRFGCEQMTQNKRVVLNALATYGRSLYSIVLGLFAGRWTLQALGEVDYGLFGVVGGMVTFVSFITWTINAAIDRYLGVSIGLMRKDYDCGIRECQKWFSISLGLLFVVALILSTIGYHIGIWAIRNFLTIPMDRIPASVWVWRFVCMSTFVSFLAIPFTAMYTGKQYIAELTLYSFVTATLMFGFQYYMVTHPGDWMVNLSLWTCVITIAPQFLIAIRALLSFPECKFRFHYLADWSACKELFMFSGWTFVGCVGILMRNQGIAILVNKYFGPAVNASYQIGNTVSGHASSLSSSMVSAFFPAIMNAYGSGDKKKAIKYAECSCKFGTLLILLFAIPLTIEIDEVLHIWLLAPPKFTAGLCVLILFSLIVDKVSDGYTYLVNANGKIGLFHTINSVVVILAFPVAWIALILGGSVYWTAGATLITIVLSAFARVVLANRVVHVSVKQWLIHITCPILFVSIITFLCGNLAKLILSPSLLRVIITTIWSLTMFIPLSYLFALDSDERMFAKITLKEYLLRMHL